MSEDQSPSSKHGADNASHGNSSRVADLGAASQNDGGQKKKKLFFLRWWFYVPAGLVAVAALVGLIALYLFLLPFMKKAETFDLAELDKLPSASRIYDRNGKEIGQIKIENREVISLDEMPDHLKNAVLAQEDARFFNHNGVDFQGLIRAAVRNFTAGELQQGGSTITMQLSRNTFALFDRTYERKLTEMFLAMRVEQELSKEEILSLYMNKIYLGRGFFGVQAAAIGYFGKEAQDLTLFESAALAGLIASPENREPWGNYEQFKGNAERVVRTMKDLGFIDKNQRDQALASGLTVIDPVPISAQSYVLDYVRQKVIDQVGKEGATSDGYNVYTTIDLSLQDQAKRSLNEHLTKVESRTGYTHQTMAEYTEDRNVRVKAARIRLEEEAGEPLEFFNPHKYVEPPKYLQGAVVVLDNEDGGIRALVGGREFTHSEFNRAVQAKRKPGSAFTPFVFATAFEQGIFPGTTVLDNILDLRKVMVGGEEGLLGEWSQEKTEGLSYDGDIPLRRALVESKNAATVRVGFEVGQDKVEKMARSAGIQSDLNEYSKTFLGESDITMMELALAYTNFPNGGYRSKEPYIITRIEDSEGKVVFEHKNEKVRAMKPSTAFQVHDCLVEALRDGTGKAAFTNYGLRQPANESIFAGKTGTAFDFTDTVFAGYSSDVTCVVWAGFDQPQTIFPYAFSSRTVLPVWVDVMNASLEDTEPGTIQPPDGLVQVETCFVSGELASEDACYIDKPLEGGGTRRVRSTYREWALPDQKPTEICPIHTGKGLSGPDRYKILNIPPGAIPVTHEPQRPVKIVAKTVGGLIENNDPWQSVKPLDSDLRDFIMEQGRGTTVNMAPKKVLKAQRVGPLDIEMRTNENLRRLILMEPKPLDFDTLE